MNGFFFLKNKIFKINLLDDLKKFSIKKLLKYRNKKMKRVINCISQKNAFFTYEKNKWNLKEIIQHLIDYEHFFLNYILLILRNNIDNIKFLNLKKVHYNIEKKSIKSLKKELLHLSIASYYFFENLKYEEFQLYTNLDKYQISISDLVYLMCEHSLHHTIIIKEKYLI